MTLLDLSDADAVLTVSNRRETAPDCSAALPPPVMLYCFIFYYSHLSASHTPNYKTQSYKYSATVRMVNVSGHGQHPPPP